MLNKSIVALIFSLIVTINVFGDSRFGFGAQAEIFDQVIDDYCGGTLNAGGYLSFYDFSNDKIPTQGLLLKLSATSAFNYHVSNTEIDLDESYPVPFGDYWRVVFEAGPAFRFDDDRIEWLLFSPGIYTGVVTTESLFIITFGIYSELTLTIPLGDSIGLDLGFDATVRVVDFSPAIVGNLNYSFSPRIGISFAPVADSPKFEY